MHGHHEEDNFLSSGEFDEPKLLVAMGEPSNADTVLVFGNRSRKLSLTVSREADCDPVRDAIVLDALLSTSLPLDTVKGLAMHLFYRHLMKDVQAMETLFGINELITKREEMVGRETSKSKKTPQKKTPQKKGPDA